MVEAPEMIGRVVDRYRVEALLGEGGFGAVYRASHIHMHRAVALKVLHARHAQTPGLVDRFLREARAASAACSEQIVEVYDCGLTADGEAFLALELLDGEDLHDRLQRGPCSVDETIAIVQQVLAGLSAAHAAGIVHRDLKPANIFLTREPNGPLVKLLDFGISKMREAGVDDLTQTGTVLGTPHYMAPEQLRSSRDVDARADLYAVGVVMYRMVSGAFPFDSDSYEGLVVKIATERIRPLRHVAPHVPENFANIVERALARDRDARFSSAGELGRALASAGGGGVMASFAGTQPVPRASSAAVLPTLASQHPPPASQHPPASPSWSPPAATGPMGGPASQATSPDYRATSSHGAAPPAPTPVSHGSLRPSTQNTPGPARARPPWGWIALAGVLAAGTAGMGSVFVLDTYGDDGRASDAAPVLVSAPQAPLAPAPIVPAPVVPPPITVQEPALAALVEPPKPDGAPARAAAPAPRPAAPAPTPATPVPAPTPATPRPMPAPAPARAVSAPAGNSVLRIRPNIVGTLSRGGVDSLIGRARSRLARCQQEGRSETVYVQLLCNPDGTITIAQPDPTRDPGDRAMARCAASRLRAAGPIEGGGSGIVFVTVDL